MRFTLVVLTALIATQAHAKSVVPVSPVRAAVDVREIYRVQETIDREPVPVTIDQVELPQKFACAKLKANYKNLRALAEAGLNRATKKSNLTEQSYYRCRYQAAYDAMTNAEQYVCSGSMGASEAQLKLSDSLQACNAKPSADGTKPVVAAEPQPLPIILVTPETGRTPASSLKSGTAASLR